MAVYHGGFIAQAWEMTMGLPAPTVFRGISVSLMPLTL